jgi:hypothetical protein
MEEWFKATYKKDIIIANWVLNFYYSIKLTYTSESVKDVRIGGNEGLRSGKIRSPWYQ